MSDEGMKVTDKRMFTPEGELREEYRFLEERAQEQAERQAQEGDRREERPGEEAPGPAEAAAPEPSEAPPSGAGPDAPREAGPDPGAAAGRPGREVEGFEAGRPEGEAPAFFDLLGALAEPVPFYLGDAPLPTGESGENLEAARFYIDLLEVLRHKTEGNLDPREADALEDLLYRLRLRYVQKRG